MGGRRRGWERRGWGWGWRRGGRPSQARQRRRGGGGGEAAASGDAASGSDALSLKTGRLPSCQRHPFDRSDEEDDVVRRPRKRLWSRRRISGARGVNNSMGLDSEFAPDDVATPSNSS
ncbi:hypothetical protein BU14_0187s0013 [Porphyra umbilicalis]|uniref:Uncharacterized protein n=1 Tax=Porphyra umbilicalis TaxID=2786 RepID=A0A1X6P6R9_PORUM|nr:hypothetical protein BU14_0187s0013 [Porphyra umbilicalis]|eukprot:OSX76534.1 hypothetical protein BU14_0187s0013 [Porphyra umbilicalis]